jgi:hypothetical protein
VKHYEVVQLGGGDKETGDRQTVLALPGKQSLDFKRERFVTSGSIRRWGNWTRSAEICSYSVALRAL